MNKVTHPGIISPFMDTSHIGRRIFSCGVWYRTDYAGKPCEITLYVQDRYDVTPCVLKAELNSTCYLCRAVIPHSENLHEELIFTCLKKQQRIYAETDKK